MGRQTIWLNKPAYIASGFTIVGPKEGKGNYGDRFDIVLNDDLWCEKSFEKCECKMHRNSITGAIKKAGLKNEDVDIQISGDLLNEIAPSSLAARNFPSAFLGLFNACSTFGEAMLIGSMLIDGGFADCVTCSTSSHFSTAERQYRFPLELGNQRTPTAQWTVTAAGCSVLTRTKPQKCNYPVSIDEIIGTDCELTLDEKEQKRCEKNIQKQKSKVDYEKSNVNPENFGRGSGDYGKPHTHVAKVMGGTIGRVVDYGIDDETNMGAAMAPAAADTILTHFKEADRGIADYDGIFTGDLGRYGKQVLEHILEREGIVMPEYYIDCGASYFKPEQKTFQGGSGTGCVNSIFNSYILKSLQNGKYKRILVVPTGALLNKDTPLQKETIPGIAHAFVVESEEL